MKHSIDEFCEKYYKPILYIFLAIFLISRIYEFGQLPNSVGVDEAGAAYDSYALANYGVDRYLNSFPLYLINFGGGQSVLYAYLTVPLIKLFGANLTVYRLPELIIFTLGIICSYLLINKYKNKKTTLIFTFLMLTCPWLIANARCGLDCNLLSGMFMIDMYLLHIAKKNYQYILAGIAVGLTLYTYAISYIIIPVFLLMWLAYMLYTKQIKIKQIILLGIPIFILALPLIYMLLLNNGICTQTQFGIFTIPKLREYRIEEISIRNIPKYGLLGLHTIFLSKDSIYLVEIPLFIIGFIDGIIKTVKSIKEKKFELDAMLTISFIAIMFMNLFIIVQTNNRCNILYIPIMYFATLGIVLILKKTKESPIAIISMIIIITLAFGNYMYTYYTNFDKNQNYGKFEDLELGKITEIIENNEKLKNVQKYYVDYNKQQLYIYVILQNKVSPYDFDKLKEEEPIEGIGTVVKKWDTYNFRMYYFEINELDLDNNYVFVINNHNNKDIQTIESKGYKKQVYKYYTVLENCTTT